MEGVEFQESPLAATSVGVECAGRPRHALWLHVDAAYGGFFALTERGKRALSGLERADSIALDPHKSLFLPYGTGALDEKLDLAARACEAVRAMPHVEIVAEPQLSVFAFRVGPTRGVTGKALDALHRRVQKRVNARQRVFLTGTVVRGMFVLRVCVLSFRTHADRMEMFLEDLRGALASC